METMAVPAEVQLLVKISDLTMLKDIKKAISMVKGVMTVKTQKRTPVLCDPETGEYLNEETMKLVERVHSGKETLSTYASFDDFEKKMREL